MREIKFRSWNIKTKRMLQVHEIYFKQNVIHSYNSNAKKGDREYGIFFPASLIEYGTFAKNAGFAILMQYTGLTDKNGKEIYEGDFFGDNKSYSIVEWSDTEAMFLLNHVRAVGAGSFANIDYSAFEVIGNIYENPELLAST